MVYFVPFAPKATRAIWKYNRTILQYSRVKSFFKLYQHYYVFGQTIVDKVALNKGLANKFSYRFDNYQEFLRVINSGPVIMIGAHVGCWEIGSAFFSEYKKKINVVMWDAEYQKIKNMIDAETHRYNVIPINEGSIEALVSVKSAIDRSEPVCFLGDRYFSKESATAVKFMGKDFLFPKGPTLLAAKFKVPVIFYFAMKEKKRSYRFCFHIVEEEMSQEALLQSYASTLEEIVTRYPQQWFNFYDTWNVK